MRRLSSISIAAFAGAVTLIVLAGTALATHNSWGLDDNAINCMAEWSGNAAFFQGWESNDAVGQEIDCPVDLGGMSNGSNGGSTIQVHATVPSLNSKVFFRNSATDDEVSCDFTAVGVDGSWWWSDTKTSPVGPAVGVLTFSSTSGWGGNLGHATMNLAIRSAAYECWVPATSAILGYRTNICANNSQCLTL